MSANIFELLREERKRLGKTQEEFAVIAGVTRVPYTAWEKSGGPSPSAKNLAALASAGADVLYILTGQRSQPTPEAALPVDERVLLNSYRICNDQARQNLIQTAALLSAGIAVPGTSTSTKRAQAKATGGVTQTVSGLVGGSVVAGNYKDK